MAVTQEKSKGMSFAEQQLIRHGWVQGKGLGKNENGISEAIKVKVKCDKGGVGHKESEQFTFHWWDHVFNKASSSLAVESGQDGVVVKKANGEEEEEEEGTISNKKPRYAKLNKTALYGFVKSATLLSGQKHPESRSVSSDDSSSSEDDEKLDLSSTTRLSDKDLMKACGGRTAHKGARHGLTMSAKLARLEQQEQEFMAKYGKTKQTDKTSPNENIPKSSSIVEQETVVKTKQKKHKKKKQQDLEELTENVTQENDATRDAPRDCQNETTLKRQKKRSKSRTNSTDTPDVLEDIGDAADTETKKKKKRKHLENVTASEEGLNESGMLTLSEESTDTLEQCSEATETISKKEKKKKKKRSEKMALEEGLNVVSSEESVDFKESVQEHQVEGAVHQTECNIIPKKKKKKSSKNKEESCCTEIKLESNVLESNTVDLSATAENMETSGKKKEKSKKRKCREEEQEQVVENGSLDEPVEKKKKKKKKERNLDQ